MNIVTDDTQIAHCRAETEGVLLLAVYQHDALTSRELAGHLGVSVRIISKRRAKLLADGLISGKPGRTLGWRVTEKGVEWLQRRKLLGRPFRIG